VEQQRLVDALSANEVSLLAQEPGFRVSVNDILRFPGQTASDIRISRIDHPVGNAAVMTDRMLGVWWQLKLRA